MSYSVKEIFYSIQGEGFYTGRPAVFCRFSGCNLWSGKASDREEAICKFCDTDFVGCDGEGGGQYATAERLVEKIEKIRPNKKVLKPFVVLTGGEPLLQVDETILSLLHQKGWEVAVETNGTIVPPEGIDWLCVSPKPGAELIARSGQELKLIFPQPGAEPEIFENLDFQYFFLQPLDSLELEKNTKMALEHVLSHPNWRLSLQTHKILGIK
ncbi:MAG: 7-carboxy-7-deazaguanine synthase [Smithella sp.]|nr:7-carboxy-7-deazaguanine synthase [Smithella sp.]